ncbi:hypothetical protein [Streptomyces erythrochromogenes]|uniref:hypothetical protein n=1 Tax=Streptomyces erythrochromogenes TaxID=285574 RepID=UPI003802E9D8
MNHFRNTIPRAALGAAADVPTAVTALAVAELFAGPVRPAAGPMPVVGSAVIHPLRPAASRRTEAGERGTNGGAGAASHRRGRTRHRGRIGKAPGGLPPPGGHPVTVRATDGTSQVQTEQRARTIPDGRAAGTAPSPPSHRP